MGVRAGSTVRRSRAVLALAALLACGDDHPSAPANAAPLTMVLDGVVFTPATASATTDDFNMVRIVGADTTAGVARVLTLITQTTTPGTFLLGNGLDRQGMAIYSETVDGQTTFATGPGQLTITELSAARIAGTFAATLSAPGRVWMISNGTFSLPLVTLTAAGDRGNRVWH